MSNIFAASSIKNPFQSLYKKSPTDKPADVKDGILAFRTITTILAKIQQRSSTSDNTLCPNSDAEREELSILNAFATVTVMNNEKVAVVADRRLEGGDLGILACQQLNDKATTRNPSSLFQFLINRNPRWDTELSNTTLIFSDPKNPRLPSDSDERELTEYIHQRWSGETLESHIWNLTKLLVLPNLAEELLPYVVATCLEKIKGRLNDKSVSVLFLTSLQQANISEFEFSPHPSPSEPISGSQQRNDKSLLVLLASFFEKYSAEFPKLIEQATRAAEDKPYALYTEETYLEFHLLLTKLLTLFHQAVGKLSDSRGNPVIPEEGNSDFGIFLNAAVFYGYTLQRMVLGSGITQHLKNLAPSLCDHRPKEPANSTMADGEAADLDEQTEDQDVDLLQIRLGVIGGNGQPQPLWKSYLDWLRLILAHFNAVEVLLKFVTGPNIRAKAIPVKILISPNVERQMLPWQKVLSDLKFFPQGLGLSNEEILKSLSETSKTCSQLVGDIRTFSTAFKAFTDSKSSDTKSLSVSIMRLKMHKDHIRWKEYIEEICSNYENLKEFPDDSESISRINEATSLLQHNASIFNFFKTMDTKRFSGAVHCEATLASLSMLPQSDTDKNITSLLENAGRIIGVSKRCCPTCYALISYLTVARNGRESRSFIVKGSHNTVSACSLPDWLPIDVIDYMNNHFGTLLRKELVDFLTRSKLQRPRTQSTGSKGTSVHSMDGPWNMVAPNGIRTFDPNAANLNS